MIKLAIASATHQQRQESSKSSTLRVLIFGLYFRKLKKESYFACSYFREWQVFENFKSTYFCE